MYGLRPCQTTEKKELADTECKGLAQTHIHFPLMESEAVVIEGKNLTYISKLATSKKLPTQY